MGASRSRGATARTDYLSCKLNGIALLSFLQDNSRIHTARAKTMDDFPDPVQLHQQHWASTFDAETLPLAVSLIQAYWAHHARASRVFSSNALSLVEFDALACLRRSPPPHALTPSEIQRSMLITSGGLTKVLRQLEQHGLISRLTNTTDRRVKPVVLTAEAMPILDAVMTDLHNEVGGWIRDALTPSELATLTALLKKISSNPTSDPVKAE